MSKNNIIDDENIVNPKLLREIIIHSFNVKQPIMIWGQPGIGKSEILEQVALSEGRPVIDIRLPLLEPIDLRGLPHLVDVKITDKNGNIVKNEKGVELTEKIFRWSTPTDFPTDEESNAVIFFDELSAATPSVQAATYQIVLNRRIGNYQLPENVVIAAAGNRVKDKSVAYHMPKALSNRLSHYTLEADIDSWIEWAIKKDIDKNIIGYLQSQPQDLNLFNAQTTSPAVATPRSWVFLNKLIFTKSSLSEAAIKAMTNGTIGTGVGFKFHKFKENADKLPKATDILSGKVTKIDDINIDIAFALISSLTHELNQLDKRYRQESDSKQKKVLHEALHACVNTFLKFTMDNFMKEHVVLAAKTLLSYYDLSVEMKDIPEWKHFRDGYGNLLPKRTA